MSDEKAAQPMENAGQEFNVKRAAFVEDFQLKAKELVVAHFNRNKHSRKDMRLNVEDVYVVWFCKTLQNWKCLISTDAVDNYYFEVTFDGDKECAYLDIYVKIENVLVR